MQLSHVRNYLSFMYVMSSRLATYSSSLLFLKAISGLYGVLHLASASLSACAICWPT